MSLEQTADERADETTTRHDVHPVEQVPPFPKLVAFGLQHLFIMYAGAVTVPLIVGQAIGLSSREIAIQDSGER